MNHFENEQCRDCGWCLDCLRKERNMSCVEPAVRITTSNGNWLVKGIQMRNRRFIPKFLGDFIFWLFFVRTDTYREITLSGFTR
jgi:hypothetical protein